MENHIPQLKPGLTARDINWASITDAINLGVESPEVRRRRREAEREFCRRIYGELRTQ